MKQKRYWGTGVAALLCCAGLLTGCAGQAAEQPAGQAAEQAGTAPGSATLAIEAAQPYDPTETGAYADGSVPAFRGDKLRLTIGEGEEVIIALYDNTAVDALVERLPLDELHFFDLSGIEKPIERLEEPLSLGEEQPGYDPVTGEMVIYRPWGNFTIFYGDFRYSEELVPLGKVERGLEVLSSKTEDFSGTLERMEDAI